ncbi:MAG TPA: hypothetical protein VMU24_13720 [Candidatus Acidoferrales bacterium]|nr:hypothetical protein [Candidatus Acidoferrales bacterium]
MKLLIGDSERLALRNAVNEVLNGFSVPDVEQRTGMSRAHLERLQNRISGLTTPVSVHLNESEMRALEESLRLTLAELGEEEFHTRVGVEFSFGQALLATLREELTRG